MRTPTRHRIAKFLCKLSTDDWQTGRKYWLSIADQIIADEITPLRRRIRDRNSRIRDLENIVAGSR